MIKVTIVVEGDIVWKPVIDVCLVTIMNAFEESRTAVLLDDALDGACLPALLRPDGMDGLKSDEAGFLFTVTLSG